MSERLLSSSRRGFMQLSAAGVGMVAASGWMQVLAEAAKSPTQVKGKKKSVILLWMDGGPSHKDTFDLKPDSKGGGEFKPIATSANGVQISEHLPKLAQWMHTGTVVRGMTSPEGAHPRAKYHLHTGYREGQGGVTYPSLGSIMAQELGDTKAAVPNFVSIGNRSYGAGFLGPKYQPLLITDASKGIEDLKTTLSTKTQDNRLGLLESMEKAFYHEYQSGTITDHTTAYQRAVALMRSKEAQAFDISQESASDRARYGSGKFAEGVLMARRLVEVGVPFVEVSLGGWDTHENVFAKVKTLSGQVDAAMSALLEDLKAHGLLDSTLVIWMGEFGRTPNINTRGEKPGRDHYPKAWSLAMFGCGQRGAVVGKTDKDGATVAERPVNPQDFLATVCELVGVDHTKQNETPTGRPIRIVDKPKPFTKEVL
ncbi:MAG: DUF1501 domain-containing protein [Fimbriiglobus sp.]